MLHHLTRYHARTIFPTEHIPIIAQFYCLDRDIVPHDHDFMEAVLVLGGTGRHLSVHGEQALGAGDAFLMRPGAWHTYTDCHGLEVYNCCFGVELLRRELSGVLQEPALNYLLLSGPLSLRARGILFLRLSPEEQAVCRGYLDTIAGVDSDSPLASVEKVGLLILLLARLARSLPLSSEFAARSPAPLHPAVRQGSELLEADPARDWSLGELANLVHLEQSYLVRQFKQGTGLSPMAYLARFRAEQAARLLLRTTLSVTEVAREIGWPDPNYFARRFRAHFGLSPTEYRSRQLMR
jgi:AraC family transcriptional regulator, L-rhamnose operon transcriptional activator RhaR